MKFFNSLPPLAKTIIVIVGVAILGGIILFIIKQVKRISENRDPAKVVSDAEKEKQQEQANGQTLSFPMSTYQATVSTIAKQLDGCELPKTEIAVIESVIKVAKKKIDWLQLVTDFNKKEISVCGSFGLKSETYDLISLLKDQLDTGGYYNINVNGYKASGFTTKNENVLADYLKTIGVVL